MMTASKVLGGLMVAGVVCGVLFQRNALSGARFENQRLRSNSEEMERLARENAEINQLRAEVQEIENLRIETREIHKLRNEVWQLREQKPEWDKLHAENQRLRTGTGPVGRPTSRAPDPASLIAQEMLFDAGLGSPEATFGNGVLSAKLRFGQEAGFACGTTAGQGFGDDSQQGSRRKGFWEKPAAGQSRVAGTDFGAETTHKNYPQRRFRPLKFPGQVGPGAATRNQHVGQEQVDAFGELLPRFECLPFGISWQHEIAAPAQRLAGHLTHGVVVFDQQDGFQTARQVDVGCNESISKIFHARKDEWLSLVATVFCCIGRPGFSTVAQTAVVANSVSLSIHHTD